MLEVQLRFDICDLIWQRPSTQASWLRLQVSAKRISSSVALRAAQFAHWCRADHFHVPLLEQVFNHFPCLSWKSSWHERHEQVSESRKAFEWNTVVISNSKPHALDMDVNRIRLDKIVKPWTYGPLGEIPLAIIFESFCLLSQDTLFRVTTIIPR